jgi:hypothetical protein
MDIEKDEYSLIIDQARGTDHYMLVKTYCQMMRSFGDMATILGDDHRLHETASCAENYSIAVKEYLGGSEDD